MRILILICVTVLVLVSPSPGRADAGNAIETAERLAAQELREPASARFLDAQLVDTRNSHGEPVQAVCGLLTARNATGDMSAASHFVYVVGEADANLTDGSIALRPYKAQITGLIAYGQLCSGR